MTRAGSSVRAELSAAQSASDHVYGSQALGLKETLRGR
jgi:hypothetical protein